jgi:hypothetical protein
MSKSNPLEEFFNLEPGSTSSMADLVEEDELPAVVEDTPMVPFASTIDDEDKAIASQLQNIHDKAMTVFHSQAEMVEIVDPKFAARNAEVAAMYLQTALNATTLRAKIKAEKDKTRTQKGGSVNNGTVNNNIIIADRNEILRRAIEAGAASNTYENESEKS